MVLTIKKYAPGELCGLDYAIPYAIPDLADGLEGVRFIHAVIESGDNDSAWVRLN